MIDNGGTLSAQLNDQSAELAALLSRTSTLVDSMATQSDSFVRGMSAAKNFTEQLDSNAPVLIYLTDHSPAALSSAQQLFDQYHNTFGAVLANSSLWLRSSRPHGCTGNGTGHDPRGLADLASIVKGDRADFALVATQGPVCNYDTPRREVGDLSPPVRTSQCTAHLPMTWSNAEREMLPGPTISDCRMPPFPARRSDRPLWLTRFSFRPASTH